MSSPSQRENGKEVVGGPRHERLPRHRVRSDPGESTPARGRPRPWWPIVTAILVVIIAVSALVPAGRHQWALSLFRQPTPYTALSFDDPTSLPTAAKPGDSLAFTFSIANHEGHSLHYAYVVTSSPGGSTPTTATTTVANGRTRAISVSVDPQCSGTPCRIRVMLPTQKQSIDFLVTAPKGPASG